MSVRLAVVIVNWNSGPLLAANLASLAASNDLGGVELRVVDNASDDGSLDGLPALPGLWVTRNPDNLGFAAAANLGVGQTDAPLLLFLNPDLTHTPDNLNTLAGCLARTPQAVGGCGRLVDADGRPAAPFQLRRLPRPAWAVAELVLPPALRARTPLHRRHFYLDRDPGRAGPVEQPAAACLLVRRQVFESVGGFDESFRPAWFEDVDLAARLRAAGHRLWYWPGAVFRHLGGYSARRLGRAEFLPLFWGNARRYYRKHFPWFGRLYGPLLGLAAGVRQLTAGDPAERAGWRAVRRGSW